jgi:hypothetical protein
MKPSQLHERAKVWTAAVAWAAAMAMMLASPAADVLADGTETLGPPSVAVAAGTETAIAGVGLALSQPGTINLTVPAGVTVKQVLLYWSGYFKQASDAPATMTITVAGNPVVGAKIGGPTFFYTGAYAATYRADVTGLKLVSPGANAISVGGLSFTKLNQGAGVLAILDRGTPAANIQVRDGTDTAFIDFASPRDTTVPQTFNFLAAATARQARLAIFAGSVFNKVFGAPIRPNVVEVTVGGGPATSYFNLLGSNDGEEWDSLMLDVAIPAGATSLSVRLLSKDMTGTGELPASLVWVGASFALPPAQGTCCCALGKPQVLTMKYTGEGPGASNHAQAAGKVVVVGDPKFAGPVRILALDKEIGQLKKAHVWFDGTVALNGTFGIDATHAGKDQLTTNTFVYIYNGGELLQSVQFHTSCSQPLRIGDQFGSLLLVGYQPKIK